MAEDEQPAGITPALRIAFALALVVILGMTILTYRSVERVFEESRWVAHTQEVRAVLVMLRSGLQDAETAQRGFVITGDESYLEPSVAAERELPGTLQRLRRLMADNAPQRVRLEALQPHITAKLAELREVLEVRRRDGFEAARARVQDDHGRREMDAIRDGIQAMEYDEEALLHERSVTADAAARTARSTFLVAAVMAIALMGLLYAVLRRHLAHREGLLARERRSRAAAEEAVAARTASEERLRQVMELRHAVITNMEEGLYTLDAQGLVTFVNPAAERIFGWSSEELLGRAMHDVVHCRYPDGRPFPAAECPLLEVRQSGTSLTDHEDTFLRRDGSAFPVTYSASPILAAGRITGLVIVFRDETQRRAVAEEREALLADTERARAAAEAASRAKDAFLATVSHELRTPLSPILAWTAMLERGTLGAEQTAKALATIRRCAQSQAQLIEDLLDVSRIVAGKMRLEVRPVELRAIIEAAVDVVRPAAQAKEIRLQAVIDTETAPVSGDPERLQQVVWNLLSNAVKFTPKGGRVTVVLERVNSHVEIAVTDTGQGIRADFLPHVFERFRQADPTSTREHMGLGLGLAIVRHIVEAHGGTVHVESPGPEQGSVFTVKLPLIVIARTAGEVVRRHPRDTAGSRGELPRLDRIRVLVVDDEPDSNEVVGTLLASCGAEVRVAGSSPQALEIMDRWKPDVVVTDIGMPGEDGYGLLAHMQAREDGTAAIPAIALTAYASVDDRVRLLSAGFAMHVGKPVEPVELVTVVARVAAG